MRDCIYEVWTGDQKQEPYGKPASCGCLVLGGLCSAVKLLCR